MYVAPGEWWLKDVGEYFVCVVYSNVLFEYCMLGSYSDFQ